MRKNHSKIVCIKLVNLPYLYPTICTLTGFHSIYKELLLLFIANIKTDGTRHSAGSLGNSNTNYLFHIIYMRIFTIVHRWQQIGTMYIGERFRTVFLKLWG